MSPGVANVWEIPIGIRKKSTDIVVQITPFLDV
jgi:hypothetical protein